MPPAKPPKLHNSRPDGIHYLVEFFGCSSRELDSIVFWKKLLSASTNSAALNILNRHFYKFAPHGVTGYILLSTSHISVHTWPEYAYAACDVFSCGGEAETNSIVEYLKANLAHEKIKTRKLKRGYRVSQKVI